MLTTHDLANQPLSLTVSDDHHHGVETVTVCAGAQGAVTMTCSCRQYIAQNWCRHLVDLACMRLRDCGITDPDIDARFEEIVAGTALEIAGNDADHRLAMVAHHAGRVDQARAGGPSRDAMESLALAARDLAEAAEAASDALRRFTRRAAGAID
ncbi:MAG: hypothetical protein JJU21_18175 [Salinarimonas sp.]|nr:hypothetical protein [Salinarimonas sp.]